MEQRLKVHTMDYLCIIVIHAVFTCSRAYCFVSNICVENLEFGTTVADPGGVDPDPDHTLEKN